MHEKDIQANPAPYTRSITAKLHRLQIIFSNDCFILFSTSLWLMLLLYVHFSKLNSQKQFIDVGFNKLSETY